MDNIELVKHISFDLTSVAHCRLGKEWNYKDIVSSFTRLYLITEGEAMVYIGSKKVILKKGFLYLIPSFTHCSYLCSEFMEQYYATFTISLPNNMSIYQLFHFRNEIKAEPKHFEYFEKLRDKNQGMDLPTGDPKVYQKNMELRASQYRHRNAQNILNSSGLLSLLLSGFIGATRMNLDHTAHDRLTESIKYIHTNLHQNLTIDKLAKRSCMSSDHYTRKFKELTYQTPLDYINRQRIQNAQLLINTTSNSFSEIAYQCGFKSNSYFSRIFRKYVKQSPHEYKNNSFSNEIHMLNNTRE